MGTTRIGISVFGILIISVIVIGVAALLIYFLVYKSAINKRIRNQNSEVKPVGETKPKRMPAPSSVAYTVIAIAVAAVMIGVWIDIRNSTEHLSNLCYQLSEKVGRLQASWDYLESEISSLSDELKKEQGLFTSVDISEVDPDYINHSVKVKITASPKSSNDDTKINVQIGDMTVKLARTNAALYSGELDIDFYKVYDDITLITVTENGQVRSEDLNFDANSLRWKFGAELSSRITVNEYEYRSGKFNISFWTENDFYENFFDKDSYKLTVKSNGSVILEDSVLPRTEKSCEVEIDGSVDVYLSAVDKCGNTHICRFYSGAFTEGEQSEMLSYDNEQVLDSQGKLIVEY